MCIRDRSIVCVIITMIEEKWQNPNKQRFTNLCFEYSLLNYGDFCTLLLLLLLSRLLLLFNVFFLRSLWMFVMIICDMDVFYPVCRFDSFRFVDFVR